MELGQLRKTHALNRQPLCRHSALPVTSFLLTLPSSPLLLWETLHLLGLGGR